LIADRERRVEHRRPNRFGAAPLGTLAERLHEFDSSRTYVLHCKSGVRSAKAVGLLRGAGFRRLLNLRGGVLAWAREVDRSLPTY